MVDFQPPGGADCFGATYHSARTVRDRDRLRQEILESRGWKIHRIWSTDWFNNREKEIQRLLRRLENCLAEESSAVVTAQPEFTEETPEKVMTSARLFADRACGGIQLDEARQRLVALRDGTVIPASSDVTHSILRKDMLEALLVNVPTTAEEFREFIPLRYREQTDADQIKFLPEILEILAQVEEEHYKSTSWCTTSLPRGSRIMINDNVHSWPTLGREGR